MSIILGLLLGGSIIYTIYRQLSRPDTRDKRSGNLGTEIGSGGSGSDGEVKEQ